MSTRSVMLIAGCAVALLATSALVVAYMLLGPSSVLVYSRTDQHGATVAALARSRAHFWGGCPHGDFLPSTPLGAVIATMDGVSREQEQSMLALARTMIGKGCGINDYSRSGTTPLMDAVIFGNPGAVRLLIGLGADPGARKKPSAGRSASPIDGLSAAGMARFLLDRPVGAHGDRKAVLHALSGPASTGDTGLYTLFVGLSEPYGANRATLRKMLQDEGYESFAEGEGEVILILTAEQIDKLFQAQVRFRKVGASASDRVISEPYLEGVRVPGRFGKLIRRVYFDPQRG